jgi:DNA-binding IscR family transcriptional regulator
VVRRILSELQKAGLLLTDAGRTGGAYLAKKPSAISLYDIYSAVDDNDLFAYNPNDPNHECALSCKMKSVLEPVFSAANDALAGKLKKIKLSELVEGVDGA